MNWEFSVVDGTSEPQGDITLSTADLRTLLFEEMVEMHFSFDNKEIGNRSIYAELWFKDHGLKANTDEKNQSRFNLFIDGAENCCEFIDQFMGITGVTFGGQRSAIYYDMHQIRYTEYPDSMGNNIQLADRIKEFSKRGSSSE